MPGDSRSCRIAPGAGRPCEKQNARRAALRPRRACYHGGFVFHPHDDLRANPPVLPRLLQVEAAHHRPQRQRRLHQPRRRAHFHQCGHEPVRAHLPGRAQRGCRYLARRAAQRPAHPCRRHAEVHPRRRQAQRPRRRGPRHLSPHALRDAGQLVLRRLLQEGGDLLGLGADHRALEVPADTRVRHHLSTRQPR